MSKADAISPEEMNSFFPALGIGKKLHFKFPQLGFFMFHFITRSFLDRGVIKEIIN